MEIGRLHVEKLDFLLSGKKSKDFGKRTVPLRAWRGWVFLTRRGGKAVPFCRNQMRGVIEAPDPQRHSSREEGQVKHLGGAVLEAGIKRHLTQAAGKKLGDDK